MDGLGVGDGVAVDVAVAVECQVRRLHPDVSPTQEPERDALGTGTKGFAKVPCAVDGTAAGWPGVASIFGSGLESAKG
jgi:hypothetical protein